MDIVNGFSVSQNQIEQAVKVCIESLDEGRLCPRDAYDVVHAASMGLQAGEVKPTSNDDEDTFLMISRIIPYFNR